MKISILIPTRDDNLYLRECIDCCLQLNYPDYEILVLPDDLICISADKVKIIPTGRLSPSQKRNMGIEHSRGEVVAFLDSDAFPDRNWLKNAVKHFDDPEVAAVGGPAVTPDNDNTRQKASGFVYSSILGSGSYRYRYLPGRKRWVDDYPSCNFLVRKAVMEKVEGFRTNFWPGEDTALCLEITRKLNKKIIYDPEVLIYHHRRTLFIPHLKQVSSYALHRGYFAKRFPQTSLKFSYFIPSFFVTGLTGGGVLSLFLPIIRLIYAAIITAYLILVFLASLNRDIKLIPLVFTGIILTHVCYGFWFVIGLLSRRLKDE